MYCLLMLAPQCSTITYFSFTVALAIHLLPIPPLYVLHHTIWPSSYNRCQLLSSASEGLLAMNTGCYNRTKWRKAASKHGVTWESPIVLCSFFVNDKWWVQYPVIYTVLSNFNCCNSSIHYRTIPMEDQKIDTLPVLATCWSPVK